MPWSNAVQLPMSSSYLLSHLAKLANEKAGGFECSVCSSFGVFESEIPNTGEKFQELVLPVKSLISVSCLWPVTAQRPLPFPGREHAKRIKIATCENPETASCSIAASQNWLLLTKESMVCLISQGTATD